MRLGSYRLEFPIAVFRSLGFIAKWTNSGSRKSVYPAIALFRLPCDRRGPVSAPDSAVLLDTIRQQLAEVFVTIGRYGTES